MRPAITPISINKFDIIRKKRSSWNLSLAGITTVGQAASRREELYERMIETMIAEDREIVY